MKTLAFLLLVALVAQACCYSRRRRRYRRVRPRIVPNADNAVDATNASNAAFSIVASDALFSEFSTRAFMAKNAVTAIYAENARRAGGATYAVRANKAYKARKATYALYATRITSRPICIHAFICKLHKSQFGFDIAHSKETTSYNCAKKCCGNKQCIGYDWDIPSKDCWLSKTPWTKVAPKFSKGRLSCEKKPKVLLPRNTPWTRSGNNATKPTWKGMKVGQKVANSFVMKLCVDKDDRCGKYGNRATCKNANKAVHSYSAVNADTAKYAVHSKTARKAAQAKRATYAFNAEYAAYATYARNAGHARLAKYAEIVTSSMYAETATYAKYRVSNIRHVHIKPVHTHVHTLGDEMEETVDTEDVKDGHDA